MTDTGKPAAHAPAPTPTVPKYAETIDAGYRASNRVWIRVWIYIVSGHVFVAFLFLLFYVGSHKG
ncbi:DUF6126 family protein [Kitasatospora phosalacinea]|uniref:Small hydrophobic protein n=1 Tax=Kitasatospora phosalacinea TaxID=2065 RepID=A0A9W6PEK3_9ACTN|nr:DUF6126 family protein [Kitasatospora phosalacinea]GLW54545.1 hypothetical protein Kpho01_25560 [Kitasatospora phosalacinea]